MGLAGGFPQRLVAEKVTSAECLAQIYLPRPFTGQASLLFAKENAYSLKKLSFSSSFTETTFSILGYWQENN